MSICNNKLLYVDVKSWTWCFCIGDQLLGVDWQLKHITLGLFEPIDISGQTLAKNLIELLDSYASRKKIIVYVKDEGSNLNIMTITLKSIIGCDILVLEESFQGICFGHAFSKACQYATTKEKVYKDLWYVLIKAAQGDLQKCIIYVANFFWKG